MPEKIGVWSLAKTIQPAHTVLISLEESKEVRLSAMHQMAKRNTKQSLKEGVTAEPDDDFEVFWALLAKPTRGQNCFNARKHITKPCSANAASTAA